MDRRRAWDPSPSGLGFMGFRVLGFRVLGLLGLRV